MGIGSSTSRRRTNTFGHCLLFLLPLFLSCAASRHPDEGKRRVPDEELRGIWITRFDWVRQDPREMEARINQVLAGAKQAGFNAVFFQVRGQAETLYPSPLEPWSEMLPAGDPGYDPLQLAIEKTHQAGLAFHAYVNLLPLWNGKNPPKNPQHLYHRHGPSSAAESSWVCFDAQQKPMSLNEYYYLNPALPQVKSYLKKVINHLVASYDIDGLHLDRIRYPGPQYLFDPYSVKQFHSDSLRHPLARSEWARNKLTELVEAVVAEALLIKPYLQTSCSAWGLYKTHDLAGYEKFSGGYDTYYQDPLLWLERGIMDFIVPMIYWDRGEPKPNLPEVWLDFKRRTPLFRHILPGLIIKPGWFDSGELAGQIDFIRSTGAIGHLLFSYSAFENKPGTEKFISDLYRPQCPLPACLDRHLQRQALALQLSEPPDTLAEPLQVQIYCRAARDTLRQTQDMTGWHDFILPYPLDSLRCKSLALTLSDLKPPFRFKLEQNRLQRTHPWLEFRQYPSDTTRQTVFNLLAKTGPENRALVDGDTCHVYKTGVYFKKLQFKPGLNRFHSTVIGPDSLRCVYGRQVYIQPPLPLRADLPLWIDSTSVEPLQDQWLTRQDQLRFRFRGSKGQQAFVLVRPGKRSIPLQSLDGGIYEGWFNLASLSIGCEYQFSLVLQNPVEKKIKLVHPLSAKVKIDDPTAFPLLRVKNAKTAVSYNLGPIRLGGPLLAEYPVGVLLQSNGRSGQHYRVRLNRSTEGYIAGEDVEPLPMGTPPPSFYLTTLTMAPGRDGDFLTIPYPQSVPFAVFPEPELSRIRIALYGVKTSSTWIIHHQGMRIIDRVDWCQSDLETYEVLVYLRSKKIWGYTVNPYAGSLQMKIAYPPPLTIKRDTVEVKGLVVAIEAGHGGSNSGAIGLSGMEEKSLNLDMAQTLAKLCSERGIRVVQVRPDDRDMSLENKRSAIEGSDAHLAISIHANASATSNGYLGASGVSTYYHNPFWADFSRIICHRLIELPLKEFGSVGSFNYRVTRMSSRPAILVEQAFMSHAEDEEKLADPAFRCQLAEKILQGIIDYVSFMFDKPVR